MTLLRDLGTFIAGLGVPIVVDGVLREQQTRLEAGVMLGGLGLAFAVLGFMRDRRVADRFVAPGLCAFCGADLVYEPFNQSSKRGHGFFLCEAMGCESVWYFIAARDVHPLNIPGTSHEELHDKLRRAD